MPRTGVFLAIVCASLALSGCRTPVRPATVPVANLYPTLSSPQVLAESVPLRISVAAVTQILAAQGVLQPLREAGMASTEIAVVARGLGQRGYAELDARRTACPVRWVVLRGLRGEGGIDLRVESGHHQPPVLPAAWGIDLRRPCATRRPRTDTYGRQSQVETWPGPSGERRVEVRRVATSGRGVYWEVEQRLRPPTEPPG